MGIAKKPFHDINEKVYRGVLQRSRRPNHWIDDHRISSAAFRCATGISVCRGEYDSDPTMVEYVRHHVSLDREVVSVTVADCSDAGTHLQHSPNKKNLRHCDLNSSKDQIILTKEQAYILAQSAILHTD